jgi:hypothetical protein
MRAVERLVAMACLTSAIWGAAYARVAGRSAATADERILELESRVAGLEAALQRGTSPPMTVRIPFMVVDDQGQPIFEVNRFTTSQGALVYNKAGKPAVVLGAAAGGGLVRVDADADEFTSVGMTAAPALGGPAMLIREAGKKRIEIGKAPSGSFSVRVNSAKEAILAGLGETKAGTGLVALYDQAGSTLASMQFLSDGRPMLGVFSPTHELLASLSQGDSGGGKLQLTDAAGTPMVEGGSAGGRGMVRTGPMPMAMLPGIPGSFIIGRK